MQKKYPFLNKNIIQSDAQKINKWGNWLIKRYNINKKILLSMWFIIHEFSENKPQKIINYFEKIHKKFPNSKILLEK